MENPINHRYCHFGPVLAATTVDQTLIDELLHKGNKTTESHASQLAGHIEVENKFSVDDIVWFVENFKKYFIPYFRKLQSTDDDTFYYGMKPFNRILLQQLWINYMQKNEYNPPHRHGGAFSFVLYLDVPKSIQQENVYFKGQGIGPGSVSFLYGEEQKGIITSHGVIPNTGDLWMFPASLKHMVPPFKSDVTRISVSGNFFITDELNKQAPIQRGEFLINNKEKTNNA
tara:strand:+ start:107 stop:793 length:687 start_codon:yes stop_codon:yes gene_type:complete